jgi:hypothetical protein
VAGTIVKRLLLVLLVTVLCLPIQVVEVAADSSIRVWHVCVGDGAGVLVRYVHSVERTWVEEHYRAGMDGLHLTMARWQSFGAGLPAEYHFFADGFYVREMDVAVGRVLDYWFLPLNEAEVWVDGNVVFSAPDTPSRVTVRVRLVLLAAWLVDSLRS